MNEVEYDRMQEEALVQYTTLAVTYDGAEFGRGRDRDTYEDAVSDARHAWAEARECGAVRIDVWTVDWDGERLDIVDSYAG